MSSPSSPAPGRGGALLVVVALAAPFAACNESSPTSPTTSPSAATDAATTGGTWHTRPSLPTPRSFLAGAVVPNASGHTIFYAIGGLDDLEQTLAKVEAFDPITNHWTTRAALPAPREITNGAGAIAGKIYLTGGFSDDEGGFPSERTLYVYDPGANSWTSRAPLPIRSAEGVTGMIDGKLYVLTGLRRDCFDCQTLYPRRLYRYDPSTNLWTRLADCPNRHRFGAGGVIDGKLYVAGGLDVFTLIDKLDVYDPRTDSWTTRRHLPAATYQAGAAVTGKKLYVIGGNTNIGGAVDAVQVYDPAANAWTTATPMPTARNGLAVDKIKNATGQIRLLAVGGTSEGTVEAFVP